jgi:hypothetical protein
VKTRFAFTAKKDFHSTQTAAITANAQHTQSATYAGNAKHSRHPITPVSPPIDLKAS